MVVEYAIPSRDHFSSEIYYLKQTQEDVCTAIIHIMGEKFEMTTPFFGAWLRLRGTCISASEGRRDLIFFTK